jgi:hypothetical protein
MGRRYQSFHTFAAALPLGASVGTGLIFLSTWIATASAETSCGWDKSEVVLAISDHDRPTRWQFHHAQSRCIQTSRSLCTVLFQITPSEVSLTRILTSGDPV